MDIVLTDGADTRTFSPGELEPGFSIFGLRGADTITGSSSAEVIFGGKDNDVILSGGGNDEVNGQNEQDIIDGGENNDILRGGKLNDLISGGGGSDVLSGDAGADLLVGTTGPDTFVISEDPDEPLAGEYILGFDGSEDRIALGGGLTPADIIIQPTNVDANDLFPRLPQGTPIQDLASLATDAGDPDLLNFSPEIENFLVSTTSGELLALVPQTTEAAIRASFVRADLFDLSISEF